MASKKKSAKEKKLHIEIITQMSTLAASAFGVVCALAWNSFIQEFVNSNIKKWLPHNGGLSSLLIYAVVVTILAVVVTLQLSKIAERVKSGE